MAKVGDAYVEVRPDLDAFGARLRAALTGVDGEKEGARLGQRVNVGFSNAMKAGIASMTGRTGLLVGSLATVAGPLSATLSGLTAGTLSLTGAIGASAGVMGTMPAALGAMVQGMGTVKVAGGGMEDAMKALVKSQTELAETGEISEKTMTEQRLAMQAIDPAARGLIRAVLGLQKEWIGLRKSVQGALFEDAASTLKSMAGTYLPVLERNLTSTASAINRGGQSFAKWAQQPRVVRDINAAMGQNSRVVGILAKALRPMANAFLNVFRVAQPYVVDMARALRLSAERFSDFTDRARKSGALNTFFHEAFNSLRRVWSILKNVGGALANTFRAGHADGMSLLTTLDRLSARWRRWTESIAGQNALKAWFGDGKGTTEEFGRLLGDIGGLFRDLAAQSDGKSFVTEVRGLIGPLRELLLQLNAGESGTNLIKTVGDLGQTLSDINAGGALNAFLQTINAFLQPVLNLTQKVPGLANVLGTLAVAFGTFKGLSVIGGGLMGATKGVVSFSSKIKSGVKNVHGFVEGFRDTRVGLSAFGSTAQKMGGAVRTNLQMVRTIGANTASNLKSGLSSAFTAVGNQARMLGTRIGLAVGSMRTMAATARAAVVQKLALARAYAASAAAAARQRIAMVASRVAMIATAVATRTVAVAQRVLNAAMRMNPIGIVITALLALGVGLAILWRKSETFRNIVKGAMAGAAAAFRALSKGVSVVLKFIGKIIGTYVRIYGALFRAGFNVLRVIVSTVIAVIRAVISGNFSAIPGIISGALGKIAGIVRNLFDAAVGAIRSAVSKATSAAKSVGQGILDAIGGFVGDMLSIGGDLVGGLVDGIMGGIDRVEGAVRSLAGKIPGPIKKLLGISSPSKLFKKYGRWTVQGFIDGVMGSRKRLSKAMEHVAALAKARFDGKREKAALKFIDRQRKAWQKQLDKRIALTKKLEKAEKSLKAAIKERAEYASETAKAGIGYAALTAAQLTMGASHEQFLLDMQRRSDELATFANNIAALRKSGLNKQTLREIVDAGAEQGGAAAAALAMGGHVAVAQANALQQQVNKIANSLGKDAASDFYGAGVNAAQGLVRGLESQMGRLERAMRKVARTIARKLRKELGIKSPSTVFAGIGDNTAQGFVQGIERKQAAAHTAIDGLIRQPAGRIGTPTGHFARRLPEHVEEQTNVRVFIGDTELTDIVRTEVTKGNVALAKRINRGRKVVT